MRYVVNTSADGAVMAQASDGHSISPGCDVSNVRNSLVLLRAIHEFSAAYHRFGLQILFQYRTLYAPTLHDTCYMIHDTMHQQ